MHFRQLLTSLLFISATSHASCQQCITPLGKVLGKLDNTLAYSNCHEDCTTNQFHDIKIGNKTIMAGMKWQCVEFARRWMIENIGYTFGSIDHAFQIWQLKSAIKITNQKPVLWQKFHNQKSKILPQKGDLLIYNQSVGPHGHVAVISGVELTEHKILIAEQNYSNDKWQAAHYARTAPLEKNAQGYYTIKDPGLIGWMRITIYQKHFHETNHSAQK